VAKQTKANFLPISTTSFSKTARAAILTRAGVVAARACKLAFSYGLDSDPGIAAKFLTKLTLKEKYMHIPEHVSKVKPPANRIPLKAVTHAFSGMPKKSAAHRDGWTLELPRFATQPPLSASLLRKYAECFSNGTLPRELWA
jgi:hypothetical protein